MVVGQVRQADNQQPAPNFEVPAPQGSDILPMSQGLVSLFPGSAVKVKAVSDLPPTAEKPVQHCIKSIISQLQKGVEPVYRLRTLLHVPSGSYFPTVVPWTSFSSAALRQRALV